MTDKQKANLKKLLEFLGWDVTWDFIGNGGDVVYGYHPKYHSRIVHRAPTECPDYREDRDILLDVVRDLTGAQKHNFTRRLILLTFGEAHSSIFGQAASTLWRFFPHDVLEVFMAPNDTIIQALVDAISPPAIAGLTLVHDQQVPRLALGQPNHVAKSPYLVTTDHETDHFTAGG